MASGIYTIWSHSAQRHRGTTKVLSRAQVLELVAAAVSRLEAIIRSLERSTTDATADPDLVKVTRRLLRVAEHAGKLAEDESGRRLVEWEARRNWLKRDGTGF